MKKFLKRITLLSPIIIGLYDYNTPEQIMTRNLRVVWVGIKILYDYKIRLNEDNIQQIHENTAKNLYEVCKKNDGLYVKFGQGVAASEHLLPPVYSHYFQLLQDKAKQSDFKDIQKIIKNDLGKDIEEIFYNFEETPVASASIAQVHKAQLKSDGSVVAVKIQKPCIQKQFYFDIFMHYVFCWVIDRAFDIPILPFAETIEQELEKELDFKKEARNAEICRKNFKQSNRTDVYIPKIYEEYTSQRTLVLEWIDGIKITNKEVLLQQGFDIHTVIQATIEAFAEQIFVTKLVHADPHPGNIFVRRDPKKGQNNKSKNNYQIVIIDFGLCYELEEKFCYQYSKLWMNLFLGRSKEIGEIVKEWGSGDEEMFATAQLMRPFKKGKPINHEFTKEEQFALQQKFKQDFRKMMGDTNKFPKELIFIGRNMNLIRSINKKMGSIVNRVNVMAKYSAIGINTNRTKDSNNYNYYNISNRYHVLMFKSRLLVSNIIYWVLQKWLQIFKKTDVEKLIDDKMIEHVNQQYQKYGWKAPDRQTYDA